jgi:hypothetical protein
MTPSALAKTIQIFLPTGEPRGIRIAELTTGIIQAVLIPRSDLAAAKKRVELDHLAVYFLFGESENSAKPILYVGQTEDVRKRLDYHNLTKDFWRTAVLGISRTHSFTLAHLRYLEWYCIRKAKEVNRFEVDNDQMPSQPSLSEPLIADMLGAFEMLSVLVSTLGFPVFQPIRQPDTPDNFYCRGPDAEATGEPVEDGFVVRQGSTARIGIAPASKELAEPLRQRLTEGGVLKEEGGRLVFTQDYVFASPSAAAMAILGRSADGWTEWKDKDKKTLHEVRRASTAE